MQKVTENVYAQISMRGCNYSYVTTSEGSVLIDTPIVPAEAKKLREDLSKTSPLRYVINNEPHPDHIAGNCWLGGTLISQDGSYNEILATKKETITDMIKFMAPESYPVEPAFCLRPPDITFTDKMTLYLGKHTFQLIHLPGHTPFQIATFVPEERVIFTSDNVTRLPIFISAVPYKWLESLEKIKQLDFDKIVPGHGDIWDKSYVDVMIKDVTYWIETVKKAVDQGWSIEEMHKKVDLSTKYGVELNNPMMGGMLRQNLENLYKALKP